MRLRTPDFGVNKLHKRKVDIAIVGGGAAGLSATLKAKEMGIEDLIILERNEELGGILPQCIHTGFGLHYFKENLTGPEYISRFVKRVKELKIPFKLATMVLSVSPKKEVIAVNSPDGLFEYRAKAVILAMGCREKTRGMLGIAGTRPAGVLTAGTAQRLMDIEGFLPGKEVVILGSGDIGLIMARRFAMEGAEVKAIVEILPYPSGLDRNIVQCLEDFNIPLLLQYTVTITHGINRVSAVTIAKVGEDMRVIKGTEKTITCDTLILSAGLIPENELSEGAGILLDPRIKGPIVDEVMETSVQGIFACGNVVHVHNLVDDVTNTGELAGKNAARFVLNELPSRKEKTVLKPGANVKYVVPQMICRGEPTTLHIRVEKPIRDAEIRIADLRISRRMVKPSETIAINLPQSLFEEVKGRTRLDVIVEEGSRK